MKLYYPVILSILAAIFLISCKSSPTKSQNDYSYISIDTLRNDNNELLVSVTGWHIEEYGLFLHSSHEDSILSLTLMGFCGTVESETWIKASFEYTMSDSLEQCTNKIQFQCRDNMTELQIK